MSIYELRKYKKMTQQQFAESIGLKRTTLRNYELGKANPPLKVLVRLSRLYGCTVDDLIDKDSIA